MLGTIVIPEMIEFIIWRGGGSQLSSKPLDIPEPSYGRVLNKNLLSIYMVKGV